jgi:hypothetical protein
MKDEKIIEINSQETRIALLEQSTTHIKTSIEEIKLILNKLESKIDFNVNRLDNKIDNNFEKLDNKIDNNFEKLDNKIDNIFTKLDNKIDSNFKWLLAAIVGLAGLMAHGFHWI